MIFEKHFISHYKIYRSILALCTILIKGFVIPAQAQVTRPVFDQYTIREGLSHNTVNCIAQDSLGYLWFGTLDGLNRFDGYNFKVYKSSPEDANSLCHNLVKSICLDEKGGMWIGTARGLSYFDIERNRFERYYADRISELSQNNIEMVFCDSRGDVWVATWGGGLNKFNKETGKFTHFKADENVEGSLSDNNVHWIFEDQYGTLWVGTEGGGLNRMNRDSFPYTFDYFQFEPEDGNYQALNCVRSIQQDHKGDIWVGTWGGGAAVLNQNTGKFNYYRQDQGDHLGVSDARVISILSASNNQMWFGTEDGGLNRFRFKDQTFEHIKMDRVAPQGLKSNNIRAIFEDRANRIWLGSSGGGVFSFHSGLSAISSIQMVDDHLNEIENQDIYAIAGDGKTLWLGTNGSGLYQGTLNQDKTGVSDHISFRNIPLGSEIVHALCHDNWGRLWVGTLGGGLSLIELPNDNQGEPEITNFTIRESELHSVSYNDIRALYNDRIGNLWIGTAGGGLDKLVIAKKGEYDFEHYKHDPENEATISDNDIRSITEDHQGNIWVGTSYGLNKLTIRNGKARFKSFYSRQDEAGTLSGNWINALYTDKDGTLWVGTDAGLNSLDPLTNKIDVYTEKDGLVNNVIKGIKGDKSGNIWITTVNGLSMFNKEKSTFYNLNESDGLLSNEFNAGAIFTNQHERILIGGTNGLNSFDPERILQRKQINALHLTDIKVFNQTVKAGESLNGRILLDKDISNQKEIRLKHFENSFSFEFAALDYSNAEKISYQYKMEGFNKKWQNTDASHRFATYTNLGGGDYVFRVRAISGVPGDSVPECAITVRIDYPLWLQWWAFIIYILLFVVISYLLRSYFQNKAKFRDDLKMANIQREKERELIDLKQRFFMNISHELKTPLTLILGPLDRISNKSELPEDLKPVFGLMKRNAGILSRLITQLMDYSKQERGVMKLKVQRVEVIGLLHELMTSFREQAVQQEIRFLMDTALDQVWAWIDEEKMEKVIFNLLSNAFKYTPPGGEIKLMVSMVRKPEEQLIIEVVDTGKGISPSHHKKLFDRFYQVDSDDTETGTGIGLSLVKDIVNLHHGSIDVESEVGKGSRFIIRIPLEEKVFDGEISQEETHQLDNSPEENRSELVNIASPEDDNRASILLVEDNRDLCSYMESILCEHYQVTIANNGEEGLKMALKIIPDLIVSDVMMPKMDGITFCNRIKGDLSVSHIPVLLLTAKSGKENTLTGFESGADDYVVKPFDTDILLARIRTLLDNRNRIKKQLQKEPIRKIAVNKVNKLDRTFLEKVEKIVLENMAHPEFSVEELGRQVGMSRTTLYRKIKGLTGMTAIEYLRNIRLKESMRFLKENKSELSAIAESVGFTDIDYFKKCFKKQFGVSPEQV